MMSLRTVALDHFDGATAKKQRASKSSNSKSHNQWEQDHCAALIGNMREGGELLLPGAPQTALVSS